MNTSASLRTNSRNDLNIVFECAGQLFTTSMISDFTYENEINIKPHGTFILKDVGNLSTIGLQSGSYGFLYFTNTSDGVEEKTMSLPIYLDDVENFDKNNQFFRYKVKWSAGNLKQMNVRQSDVISQSNSTDALKKIFDLREATVAPYNGATKPTDNMNWIVVNQDMWQQLQSIVSKSFLPNDFIYWVWDDVNNKFKISSIATEFNKKDSYLLIRDVDVINSTIDATQIIGQNELIIWRYDAYKKFSVLGSLYKKLFPNVSFLGVPTGIIKSGGIKRQNFMTLLKTIRDNKLSDVLSQTGLGDDGAVFGELQIRKQHLNGHDLYAFADIYRDYKISTYAKMFMSQLYNSVGPPIGTYVSVFNVDNTTNSSGVVEVDNKFSDRYMVVKKIIQYKGKTNSSMGKEIDASTNFSTTLFLASDNYLDGFDNVSKLLKKVSRVT